jgi:long-chain acyl-CoA synthetase
MRGENVVAGYFEDAEETGRSFSGGWFHSGDLGYRDGDGFFFLRGRKKEIIIRGGVNIHPAEIDPVLEAHPEVAEAVSFGLPDGIYGEEVYAAVTLRAGSRVREEELLRFCRQSLSELKCPKKIFVTSLIPRTASGKPRRRDLSQIYRNQGGIRK